MQLHSGWPVVFVSFSLYLSQYLSVRKTSFPLSLPLLDTSSIKYMSFLCLQDAAFHLPCPILQWGMVGLVHSVFYFSFYVFVYVKSVFVFNWNTGIVWFIRHFFYNFIISSSIIYVSGFFGFRWFWFQWFFLFRLDCFWRLYSLLICNVVLFLFELVQF